MDLDSIVPATETLTVAGKKMDMRGVTARELNVIKKRFPNFLEELGNTLTMAPEAASAMLAASAGKIGDTETEKFFDELPIPVGRYIEIVNKVVRLSFGPFAKSAASSQENSSTSETAAAQS